MNINRTTTRKRAREGYKMCQPMCYTVGAHLRCGGYVLMMVREDAVLIVDHKDFYYYARNPTGGYLYES